MMSEKERFVVGSNEIGEIIVTDVETDTVYHYGNMGNFLGLIRLLNEQQDTIKNLQEGRDYWKQKYEEGTETFTFPPNCDECDFLGNNGICGYCKFTLHCYDSKEDLMDGEVLPNCPLKPLINENRKLREMNKQLREINKEIGDDLYNCRVNKDIISKEKDEKINELEKRWNECEKFRYQVFQRLNELNKD